jgi:hypothetical protein
VQVVEILVGGEQGEVAVILKSMSRPEKLFRLMDSLAGGEVTRIVLKKPFSPKLNPGISSDSREKLGLYPMPISVTFRNQIEDRPSKNFNRRQKKILFLFAIQNIPLSLWRSLSNSICTAFFLEIIFSKVPQANFSKDSFSARSFFLPLLVNISSFNFCFTDKFPQVFFSF